MIAQLRLVVVVVILDELGHIVRYRRRHAAGHGVGPILIISRTLGTNLLAQPLAVRLEFSRCLALVEVAVGNNAAHIVHSRCSRGLDARIRCSGINGKAAPAANTEDADLVRVDIFGIGKEIDGCQEILGIDIR